MFLNKLLQLIEISLATILLSLHSVLINIERWESVDAVRVAEFFIKIVSGSAVNMTDHNTIHTFICLSQLFPGWSESLTVSTPRGVELDESHSGPGLLLEVALVELHHGSRGLLGWLGHFPVISG